MSGPGGPPEGSDAARGESDATATTAAERSTAQVATATAPLVELQQVRKSFGDNLVLDGVDLKIERGAAVVIAGPSGSGKSTLLRCINGLEPVDSGEIRFEGQPVDYSGKALSRLRAEIGMVFQQFNLFPHLTVRENIVLGPVKGKGMPREEASQRARELLQRVGIPEKENGFPADLSGGQQQRVAIARALAMDPKLMLFDEPTSALDPEMIREVLDVMRDLARNGMTMVVVTHEMGFAREVCDSIVFIDAGEIVEQGPPDEFFRAAKSPRAKEFVDKIIHH
jgi:glutamate transport system ATP-binding protein